MSRDWTYHRPPELLGGKAGMARGATWDDAELVERIVKSYRLAAKTRYDEGRSQWNQEIHSLKQDAHRAFSEGLIEEAAQILRHPIKNYLFLGFDNLSRQHEDKANAEWWGDSLKNVATDRLVALAESLAIVRLDNPEAYAIRPSNATNVGDILSGLDHFFAARVSFPNPYDGELGLETDRGVASDRAIYAL
jgi:hypothetical protein